jgi:methyl-accepting chemotaxis protein
MSHPDRQDHVRRRRYLLDSRWQAAVAGGTVAVAAVVGLLGFLVSYALTNSERLERLSSGQLGLLAALVNALYIALVTSVLVLMAIRLTHTVAGPARVLQRAIDALRSGRFDSRLELRKHDYLKDLAQSLGALTEDLRLRRESEQRLAAALEGALARNDLRAAREAVQALRGLCEPAARAEPERAAA